KEDSTSFIEDIKKNAADLVTQVTRSGDIFAPKFSEMKSCPYCKTAMMKVVDEIGQNHYICQKLSCSYEEREVKKRIPVVVKEKPVVVEKPKATVKVVAKAKPVGESNGKKRVVLVKKALPKQGAMQSFSLPDDPNDRELPSYTWETVIEVVRMSKLAYRNEPREMKKYENRPWGNSGANTAVVEEIPRGGGTFADFMKASENRKKRDQEKKKR
ncbi:MAG: DNA topoisomerase III, partial [Sphaerochaeta sp.]